MPLTWYQPHHPMVLFVLKPVSDGSDGGGGGGLNSRGFAGSTKITHPSKNLAFIPSRAFSASSRVAYLTKPNPLDLPETLSVTTFAAIQITKNYKLQLILRRREWKYTRPLNSHLQEAAQRQKRHFSIFHQ